MRVLGIDSAELTGFAVVAREPGGRECLQRHGTLTVRSSGDVEAAVAKLAAAGPDVVAIEAPFIRANVATGLSLATLLGRWLQEWERRGAPTVTVLASTWQIALLAGLIDAAGGPLEALAAAGVERRGRAAARGAPRALPEWFAYFAFLLLTGARRGEAAGLRWEDVDLARRVVTIRRSYDEPPKSGRARTVPISAELAAILTRRRMRDEAAGALVFPNPLTGQMLPLGAKLGPILDGACQAAGIPRMRVHDLRHAHASLWLMGGGSIADVQRNLGHSTPVLTTETYGHIAEDHRVRESDQRLTLGLAAPGPRALDNDAKAAAS